MPALASGSDQPSTDGLNTGDIEGGRPSGQGCKSSFGGTNGRLPSARLCSMLIRTRQWAIARGGNTRTGPPGSVSWSSGRWPTPRKSERGGRPSVSGSSAHQFPTGAVVSFWRFAKARCGSADQGPDGDSGSTLLSICVVSSRVSVHALPVAAGF